MHRGRNTECARKNGWISQAKNVLKLHQIKLLLIPSNSQVYKWNTKYSIWCPWVLIQVLRRLLKFITLTISEQQHVCELIVEANGEPTVLLPRHLQAYERSLAVQVVFFFSVDTVARTESTHFKILFRLGTLIRRPSWKWVRNARWVAITESPFLKNVSDETTSFSSENKRCAALQLSIFRDLSCHSNWNA